MKFWKKIFLYSTLLTMILINGVGIIIIERIHNNNLNIIISDVISNEKNLINSFYLSYDTNSIITHNENYSYDTNNSIDNYINSNFFNLILKNYIYKNDINIKNIQILTDKNQIITSLNKLNFSINNSDFLNVDLAKYNFIITELNNEKVVSVSSKFKLGSYPYKIILTKSINSTYENRINNYKVFFILDIFINLLLIIGMYLISKHLTKPIVELANVSVDIANGEYNKRSTYVNDKDEIGILSKNFNLMMEVLESKIAELQNVNSAKERFINNFTHEIKTPITSIIGYSDLLLKSNIDETLKRKSLEYINSEGRRLEKLSSSLMSLILIKASNIENNLISLKDCISSSLNSLSYKINDKNIHLHVDLFDINIIADRQLINILLINLIDNSIKACSTDGNIDIVGKKIDNKFYNLYIKDDGIGIPPNELDKIMEPFYMVDKSRGKSNNGLGLGLSICSEICNLYNIGFNISSSVNNGTNIKLTIIMEA